MPVELDPQSHYQMPVAFGPSVLPAQTAYTDVEIVSISWHTERGAVSALVPSGLELPDSPVVTLSRMSYSGVDYLGGRPYEELTVGISVSYAGTGRPVRGQTMPVVWIDDGLALIVGRELLGYAKLPAVIPAVERHGDGLEYSVYEYDAPLLRGSVNGLERLDDPALARLRRATQRTTVFGWKYVPALGGGADAEYLTQIALSFDVVEGWSGHGDFTWECPDDRAAPFSARIAETMSAVPVVGMRPAFVGHGPGRLYRLEAQRLS